MRPGLRRVIAWLTIYELTYFTTIVASSLLSVSGAPFQGFEGSAGKSSALIGVVTTWLNDVAILLTVATLVVIHPLLGVPAIALYSTPRAASSPRGSQVRATLGTSHTHSSRARRS